MCVCVCVFCLHCWCGRQCSTTYPTGLFVCNCSPSGFFYSHQVTPDGSCPLCLQSLSLHRRTFNPKDDSQARQTLRTAAALQQLSLSNVDLSNGYRHFHRGEGLIVMILILNAFVHFPSTRSLSSWLDHLPSLRVRSCHTFRARQHGDL